MGLLERIKGCPDAPATEAPGCACAPIMDFTKDVSQLMTCDNLDHKVLSDCSSKPVWSVLQQFRGNHAMCIGALQVLPELSTTLAKFLGPGANCDTMVEMWSVMHHFECRDACIMFTRVANFA